MSILAGMIFFFMTATAGDYLKTEYSYRKYTTQDGLPDMMINCLYQDSKGYIWLGLSSGLACYDGVNFQTILSGEASIYRITENTEGKIEAFTHLSKYVVSSPSGTVRKIILDKGLFLRPEMSHSLPRGYAIYETLDRDNRYICNISDSIQAKRWSHQMLTNQPYIYAPYWDINNRRLILSDEDKTSIFDEDGNALNTFPTGNIGSFIPYSNGFWAIGADGVYRLTENNLKQMCKYNFSTGTIICGLMNKDGQLIIMDGENLYQYTDGQIEMLYHGIVNPTDMVLDKEGNLWVTSYKGLYCFFRMQFKNYILPGESDLIRSALVDQNDRLWLGTLNGELICINGEKQEKINYPLHANGNFFHPFPAMYGNALFFNTTKILRYQNEKFSYLNMPSSPYLFITSLPNGNIVATGNKDMCIFRPDGHIIRSLNHQDLHQSPRQVAVDNSGRLWVTGMNGITIIDNDSIHLMNQDEFKPSFIINHQPPDKMWFNSENRLYMATAGTVRLVHTFEVPVRGIHITRNGILVVATSKGIYLSSAQHPDLLFYNCDNGFTGSASFNSNMVEDSKGNIYLLTLEHMVQFNPAALIREQPTPLLHLQSVQSSTDNIRWKDVKEDPPIEFDYRNKNLKFNYIGICYSASGNIRYQYRLLGFQNNWTDNQSSREAIFNNLPPGRYEFQLKANSGAPGTETPAVSQSFIILPAFWQTWWFYAICIAALIFAGGWAAYRYISKKNAVKIKALERQKQLNNLQIQSIRLRSIPHFNANVLAGIEYYIMNFSKEEANHYLAMYSSFTNLTLSDVDRPARTLAQEIRYVELYLGLEKMRYGEHFDFSIEVAPDVDKEIMLPNMILHTHCENALKHGLRAKKGKGHLRIVADPLMADEVLVVIEDDGIGRTEAKRLQTKGTGQGLVILSQQIDLYNQTNDTKIIQRFIDLTDGHAHACGTRVEIEVPKGYKYN